MPDFTYTLSDGFYSIFPESPESKHAIVALMEQSGSNKLLPFEFDAFRKQARKAGYSISKAKLSGLSDNDLLAELSR